MQRYLKFERNKSSSEQKIGKLESCEVHLMQIE